MRNIFLLALLISLCISNYTIAQSVSKNPVNNLFLEEYESELELLYYNGFKYIGDINGDGDRDFYFARTIRDLSTEDLGDFSNKALYFNGGIDFDLEAEIVETLSSEANSSYYPVGDLNGDGISDFVSRSNLSSDYIINFDLSNGLRNNIQSIPLSSEFAESISNGDYLSEFDLNGDGFQDVIIQKDYRNNAQNLEVKIIFGADDPDSTKFQSYTITSNDNEEVDLYNHAYILPADLDADGKYEIVVFGYHEALQVQNEDEIDVLTLALDSNLGIEIESVLNLENIIQNNRLKAFLIKTPDSSASFFIQNNRGEKKIVELLKSSTSITINQELDVSSKFSYAEVNAVGDIDNNGVTDFIGPSSINFDERVLYFGENETGNYTSINLTEELDQSVEYLRSDIRTPENTLGDINDDGIDDLMLYHLESEGTGDISSVVGAGIIIINGNESRNLQDTVSYFQKWPEDQVSIASFNAGDFNNDGIEDYGAIFKNNINSNKSSRVEIYFGATDKIDWETPDLILKHENGYLPSFPAVGDFNGDQIEDLAVNYENESGGIRIYFGGTATDNISDHEITLLSVLSIDSLSVTGGYNALSTVVNLGDLNKDNSDELGFSREFLAADQINSSNWYVAYGGGGLTNTYDLIFDGHRSNFEAVGDIDSDGNIEFLAASPIFNSEIVEIYEFDTENEEVVMEYSLAKPETVSGTRRILGFGNSSASGDFNGDGIIDLVISSSFHSNGEGRAGFPPFDYTYEGGDAVFVYYGGPNFDTQFDHAFKVGIQELRKEEFSENTQYVYQSNGELTSVPDIDDDLDDELLFGTDNQDFLTNAVIFSGQSDSLNFGSETIFMINGLNNNLALGSINSDNKYRVASSAVGDFDSDGRTELLLPQPDDANFKSDVISKYNLYEEPVSNEDNVNIISSYSLNQNYPNPFNPSTNISYSIPQTTDVSLKIYDMNGRLVSTLVNKRQASGTYNVSLNASAWASGIYFYRIVAGDFVKTRKLTLIK